jgi:hypothetical protein
MTSADLLPAAVLRRKAVVYVRQSTPAQVQTNLESQRRQYELVEVARRRGLREVEVIDDDLGRSASGRVAQPGKQPAVNAFGMLGGTKSGRGGRALLAGLLSCAVVGVAWSSATRAVRRDSRSIAAIVPT